MIICHCIKEYEEDGIIFEPGKEYYYHVDKDGDILVCRHMAKYADGFFKSLKEFHKYFKDY